MRKSSILVFLFFLASFSQVFGQIFTPTTWKSPVADKKEVNVGDEITLTFEAKIIDKWYLYSSDFDPDLGPMVTSFTFKANDSYELVGGITPVNPNKKYDDLWEGDITYFKKTGLFTQKVKVLSKNFKIQGTIVGQACSDIDGQCVPFEKDFSFSGLKVTGEDMAPVKKTEVKSVIESTVTDVEGEQEEGLLGFMLTAFLFGLTAIFTPCVFPMIPLTVSFFTKQKGGLGKALLYGFFIVLIYTLVGGILVPFTKDPGIANLISTHWLPNTIFFVVFIIFALSFFGLFEITLPSSVVNKMDRQSDRGGLFGIFFMALTLTLVSFSCTGPIVGSILIESIQGGSIKPVLGMAAFGLAFALPFTIFAAFPKLMDTMPKSGGWLNSVKVVLGFVELAFAFKFLSTIDLVLHWNLLDKDVMLSIWIATGSFLGLYLLGKIRLPHDYQPVEQIGVFRMLLALGVFTFVVYMIPGLFGAPVNVLSGILPPQTHHNFDMNKVVRDNIKTYGISAANASEGIGETVKYGELFELPHGLEGYFEYEQALEASKREGKPIFIDFTGHGCANCRRMEDLVWKNPEVLKRLQNDYIVLALYVDDRTELPESAWITAEYDGKVKTTIGQINQYIQFTKYNGNAQPYYIITDETGSLFTENGKEVLLPRGYDTSISGFVEFLDKGKQLYQNK
ncbi:protein-disulfide reductase DsbD family protein [Sediminitomix flava]|uniref:Thiol:disulfide interchange protein DsbD n=1 Tax=Sediminitomix flava TaxID=379075 RepID=A0A315Z0C3_SEDFL|nr:thioredoxin family protein [Sediminitomix flava]PWJ36117.1 thiol:disulfide interchange protein DsbD [Sediminitomix flava]